MYIPEALSQSDKTPPPPSSLRRSPCRLSPPQGPLINTDNRSPWPAPACLTGWGSNGNGFIPLLRVAEMCRHYRLTTSLTSTRAKARSQDGETRLLFISVNRDRLARSRHSCRRICIAGAVCAAQYAKPAQLRFAAHAAAIRNQKQDYPWDLPKTDVRAASPCRSDPPLIFRTGGVISAGARRTKEARTSTFSWGPSYCSSETLRQLLVQHVKQHTSEAVDQSRHFTAARQREAGSGRRAADMNIYGCDYVSFIDCGEITCL